MTRISLAVLGSIWGFCFPTITEAHEFIGKPASMTAAAGSVLPVLGISSHVFMVSEELEEAKDVMMGILSNGKRAEIPLKANDKALAFEGTVTVPTGGTFIVTGVRLPQIWATTPDGSKPATKKTPGATNARKIEKFSKALVNAKAEDNGFSAIVGDPLEIVPITNPATAKVGDEITVKVIYKGQPLTTNVYATYDGFSKEENTYAYFTEGRADGTAKVKITHPGTWMVRVEHAAAEVTEDYDRYVGRAVLLFEVK